MNSDGVTLVGGPKNGKKIPIHGPWIAIDDEDGTAVYKMSYSRARLFYVFVGYNCPNFQNCFRIDQSLL